MKRNFLTVLVTGVLILAGHSHAALASSEDEQFLGIIGAAVADSSSDVQTVAKAYDAETMVGAGKGLCQKLSEEGGDPDQVIQKTLLADTAFQNMQPAAQKAEAYYFGIVLAAASYTYCPEYKDAVQAWSKNK